MVEPLLHFAVPFASLKTVGVDTRKAALASLVALIPDLDVFFHLHRSQSHSIVLLLIIAFPLLLLTWKRRALRALVLIGTFGILTHLVLDLFQAATPLFWPLTQESFFISIKLNLRIGGTCLISGSPKVVAPQTTIEPFVSFDEQLLTGPGLAVSMILLAPTLVRAFVERLTAQRTRRPW